MISKYEEKRFNGRRYLKHRLIWEQHFGEIPKGYEIHHIDGNTHNNNIENLQLISSVEHRSLHAKRQKGRVLSDTTKDKIRNKRLGSKATNETKKKMSESYSRKVQVKCVELNIIFNTIQEAADYIHKDRRGIYGCIKGEQNTCGGYHWQLITGEENND